MEFGIGPKSLLFSLRVAMLSSWSRRLTILRSFLLITTNLRCNPCAISYEDGEMVGACLIRSGPRALERRG
jgi:hypothetical protein